MKIMVPLGILAVLTASSLMTQSEQVWGQSDQTKKQPQANTLPSAPVLGYLELRDQRVVIKAGSIYTIYTKDGKVLAEDVTLEQLQAYPSLHRILENAIAADGSILDASMRINR